MQDFSLHAIKRVNEATDAGFLGLDEVQVLKNMVLDEQGSTGIPTRRGGIQPYNANDLDDTIYGMYDAVDCDGDNYLLLTLETKIVKSSNGTGTYAAVKSGLSFGKPASFFPLGNGEYLVSNGYDEPFIISGSGFDTVISSSITRPTVGTLSAYTTSGANNLEDGKYTYAFVYSDTEGTVSLPSDPVSVTPENMGSNATGIKITIHGIPVSTDNRVKKILIYRSKENGDTLYYHSSISNTTETNASPFFSGVMFEDGLPDAELDLSTILSYASLPVSAKYGCIHKQRLFLANVLRENKNYLMLPKPISANTTAINDGTNVWTPAVDYEAIAESGSNLTDGFTYTYAIVAVNEFDQESAPIYISKVVNSPNLKLSLTNIPAFNEKGAFSQHRKRIYRSSSYGTAATYYFHDEIDIDVTEYTDTTDDSLAFAGGNTLSILSANERYADTVLFSDTYTPLTMPLENTIRISPDSSNEITGIVDDGDGILVFKRDSIHKVYTYSNTTNWNVVELFSGFGCDDPAGIIKVSGGIYFSYKKRIYYYSGTTPNIVNALFLKSWSEVESITDVCYIPEKGWLVFSVVLSDEERILIYDEKLMCWYTFTVESCKAVLRKQYGDDSGTLLIGGDAYLKWYDTESSGDNENGTANDIAIEMRSKLFSIPDRSKTMRLRFFTQEYETDESASVAISISDADETHTKIANEIHTSAGKKLLHVATDGMAGDLQKTNSFQLTIQGTGITSLQGSRITFRTINHI